MKKVLIASTALVAAGLLTAGTASASEKIKLNLGGFSKWWVVGAWQGGDYDNIGNNHEGASTNVDVKGDVEVFFGGKVTLDNGIEIGVDIQLEGGGQSFEAGQGTGTDPDTIDESYVWIAGGFGKAIIGTENNGVYLLHVTAPDAAGNWNEGGMMTGNWAVAKPNAVRSIGVYDATNSTAIRAGNDTEKVTYVAPTFYGLTVGASYIPNAIRTTEDNANVSANEGGVPGYGVGALYANTFGGVGVKVSGGYVWYDASAALAGSNDGGGNSKEWSVGTQLSYAGFTLGGSYRNANDDSKSSASYTANDGDAYDVGVQYASGPYAVSLSYFKSSMDGAIGAPGDDEIEFYQLSGKYTLGAGVDVLASVGHANYENDTQVSTSENKGWVAMTGLSLAF